VAQNHRETAPRHKRRRHQRALAAALISRRAACALSGYRGIVGSDIGGIWRLASSRGIAGRSAARTASRRTGGVLALIIRRRQIAAASPRRRRVARHRGIMRVTAAAWRAHQHGASTRRHQRILRRYRVRRRRLASWCGVCGINIAARRAGGTNVGINKRRVTLGIAAASSFSASQRRRRWRHLSARNMRRQHRAYASQRSDARRHRGVSATAGAVRQQIIAAAGGGARGAARRRRR